MSEKEERIYIKKVEICDNPKSDIKHCSCLNHYQEEGLCWRHPDYNGLLPRSEAIERIAKAMCHSPFKSCEGCIVQKKKQACKQAFEGMKGLAEIALDALLEK